MKDRLILGVVLFFVFGSSAISSSESVSYTAKSIFHGIGLFALGLIGIISLYNSFKKGGRKETL